MHMHMPQFPLLILFRHGQTDYNAQRRFQGQGDIPLNATGRQQALRSGEVVANMLERLFTRESTIVSCLSSDLSRACETSEIVAQTVLKRTSRELKFTTTTALREYHCGALENHTVDEFEVKFPGELQKYYTAYETNKADAMYPGGGAESRRMMCTRLAPLLANFATMAQGPAQIDSKPENLAIGYQVGPSLFPKDRLEVLEHRELRHDGLLPRYVTQDFERQLGRNPFAAESADPTQSRAQIHVWSTHGGVIDSLLELMNTELPGGERIIGNGDVLCAAPVVDYLGVPPGTAPVAGQRPVKGSLFPTHFTHALKCHIGWKILRHYRVGDNAAARIVPV